MEWLRKVGPDSPANEAIRVGLIEDSHPVREGIIALLCRVPGLDVVTVEPSDYLSHPGGSIRRSCYST